MNEASCDVMMVDDDALTLMLMTRRLRDSTLVLETCATAAAARERLASGGARLLLVDLHMRPVGGVELLESLHAEGALDGMRAFICTSAPPDAPTIARIEALGARVVAKETVLAEGGVTPLLADG